MSAHTGRLAKGGINNPANLGNFAEAASTAARLKLAGVGFVLRPDDGVTGIDLDDCITDSGSFSQIAGTTLSNHETYAEISPSGEGIRIFALGKPEKSSIDRALGIEIYGAGRYLTVTGNQIRVRLTRSDQRLKPWHYLAAVSREKTQAKPNGKTASDGSVYWSNVNTAALANLDCWVPALHPTAKKQATGAWRITSRALGQDLEEESLPTIPTVSRISARNMDSRR